MLQTTDKAENDGVNPTCQDFAVVRIPVLMKAHLELMAHHETELMNAAGNGKQTPYGTPKTDNKRLALWVPIADVVMKELARRRKLKSWSE